MSSIILRRSLPGRGGRAESQWMGEARRTPRGGWREVRLPAQRLALMVASMRLGRRDMWQRGMEAFISVVIVGGVLVVPVACVLAIVGAWMPGRTPLHETGAQLLAVAILWFMTAVFCAHLRPRPEPGA